MGVPMTDDVVVSRVKVWVAHEGDYEQRRVNAVYATEELAKAHGEAEDLEEWDVWDLPPKPVTRYEVTAVIGPYPYPTMRVMDGWAVSESPMLHIHRDSWDTYEVHCPEAFTQAEITPSGKNNIWIESHGNDEQAVEAEVRRAISCCIEEGPR